MFNKLIDKLATIKRIKNFYFSISLIKGLSISIDFFDKKDREKEMGIEIKED